MNMGNLKQAEPPGLKDKILDFELMLQWDEILGSLGGRQGVLYVGGT